MPPEPIPKSRPTTPRRLSLALQGGGSFGAFTAGVLDGLLAEKRPAFDMVSGASAGAINAVLLADGLAEGGRPAARDKLERFWNRVSLLAPLPRLGLSERAAASAAVLLSPYQFNPLGLDPLRAILASEVDFDRLRRTSPVRLLIATTRVRDGSLRLFREDEISLEAVLASACLPHLHHAVEIDNEAYWDGGLTANPPLRRLVEESAVDDVLLVQLTPNVRDGVPHSSGEISRRVAEINFAHALQHELDALAAMTALCGDAAAADAGMCGKLRRLRLHRIAAEDSVVGLQEASPMDTGRPFIHRLRAAGQEAAAEWLASDASQPQPASLAAHVPVALPRTQAAR
jgi:NTE family protein